MGLVGANVATFIILWSLLIGQGNASESLSRPDTATPNPFQLSEPTLAPQPTDVPTQVIVFAPTPTKTPKPSPTQTQVPTQTPTATSLAPTAVTDTPIPVPPEPTTKYVVIISIDGLRPDALDIAYTPNLDELKARGTYFPNAQTVKISVTLPSHASMLSGMVPEKHGILWGEPFVGWPGMNGPTLFTVAHDAGLRTAMVFGKEKLNYLVLGDSVDTLFGEEVHDTEVKNQAVKVIQENMPNVLFIHFPDTDRIGHDFGWMSANQFDAITFVDGLIGEIVATLGEGGHLDNTLLIVTADHGGHGSQHGDDSPPDRTIPWLAVGPGVPSGVTLPRSINTYDTAATVLYALDLPIPENWDGQPVLEIFE